MEASLLRRQKRLLSAIPYAAVGETLVTLRKLVGCRGRVFKTINREINLKDLRSTSVENSKMSLIVREYEFAGELPPLAISEDPTGEW